MSDHERRAWDEAGRILDSLDAENEDDMDAWPLAREAVAGWMIGSTILRGAA